MESWRAWVAAARLEDALLATLCVLVGSSYARFDAQPGPGFSADLAITIAALAAGVAVNLLDHAWKRLQAPPPDPKNPVPEPRRPLDGRYAAIGAGVAIVLAVLCGLGLVPLAGGAALGYGALAVVLALARGIPAVGLDELGWGLSEIAAVIALGPLAASAGFASQAGTGASGAVLAGIPAGLVAATPLLARRFAKGDGGSELRQASIALPLLAAAAAMLAVRGSEYPPFAHAAALPMALLAAAAWRLPKAPNADDGRRWKTLATVCAIASLVIIVVTLRSATSV